MSDYLKQDMQRVSGRKKVYALYPKMGRQVLELMSDGVMRKESEIIDRLPDRVLRGKVTHFCRCIKDRKGRSMFIVSGNRPRNIQFVAWEKR